MNTKLMILLAAASITLAGCGGHVDTGEVGFKKSFGAITTDQLNPGVYLYNPLFTTLVRMNIQTQKWSHQAETYTRDIQKTSVAFTINYHLDKKYAIPVYSLVGEHWAANAIPQAIQQAIKNELGRWTATEVIPNRALVTSNIESALRKQLATNHIIVDKFDITDLNFTDEFEKAVEAKQVATQNALAEQNKTVAVTERGKQTIISAKAEAEAMKIKAAALTENPKLVQYNAVMKWDGHLPTYVNGPMPMISVPAGN